MYVCMYECTYVCLETCKNSSAISFVIGYVLYLQLSLMNVRAFSCHAYTDMCRCVCFTTFSKGISYSGESLQILAHAYIQILQPLRITSAFPYTSVNILANLLTRRVFMHVTHL